MRAAQSLTFIATLRQTVTMTAVVVPFVFAGSVRAVAAQSAPNSRAFVSVNGGYQVTSTDFSDKVVFPLFLEDGDFQADYKLETGPVYDVSGGVRLWRNLAVGGGVSFFDQRNEASVMATLPHPFFFDRNRSISGEAPDLQRREIAVHIQALWMIAINNRFDLILFGGPTFFDVTQDLVEDVEFSSTFPFDTATFTGASLTQRSESGVGFNVGADAAFYFSQHVGIGFLIRFSGATIDIPTGDDGISIDVGGLQTGGGLRLRF